MVWMDWVSLFIRWFHVIAGVAWIGASFYFIWLDNNLQQPPEWKKNKGIKGDLWAVHGGGFYEVAKYQYGPEKIPETLHWFKWEAYTTWISGFSLLILVYYFGASAFLIDPNIMELTQSQAVLMGLGLIFGGMLIYEVACRSPLAKSPLLFAIFLLILLTVAAWLATQWFSGRGAYIHIGALIGTIMVANVFLQIMPSQRAMVDAVKNKQEVDPSWGEKAKLRSVHNNYLTLPILFIMISNHYPMTYLHEQNWLVLIALCVVSAWIRHFFNLKHLGVFKPSILISGAVAMLAIAIWVSAPNILTTSEPQTKQGTELVSQSQVKQVLDSHCVSCHSKTPTDPMFPSPPLGLVMDDWKDVENKLSVIYQRVFVTRDMPFLNKTQMTNEERKLVADWYLQNLN
ncbi:urate hydroxylase PuuD [Aliiglaciecola sp. 2_MG-2023]|uniref:urate hydroxylase PuuD n=1 Tax=unclassified Aliiglaciecola TaxID=2593648 RepID=UPI0026E13ED7|nr:MULTISPECIES: urate hydroxylase PuuD [unclassified Aliiglaciecola]MDO6710599.1 urate hydroxylase PuuD [Aliiglaciecola sp. 2_MG-2023]MDO6751536.1 urate hydroxylase PuuD [Aliiglaciecola sp. 1_MG-2023]